MTETKPRYDFDPSILLDGVTSGRYKIEHYMQEGVELAVFDDAEIKKLNQIRQGIMAHTDPHFQPSQDGFFLDTLPRSFESDFSRDRRLRFEKRQKESQSVSMPTVIFNGIKHLFHIN